MLVDSSPEATPPPFVPVPDFVFIRPHCSKDPGPGGSRITVTPDGFSQCSALPTCHPAVIVCGRQLLMPGVAGPVDQRLDGNAEWQQPARMSIGFLPLTGHASLMRSLLDNRICHAAFVAAAASLALVICCIPNAAVALHLRCCPLASQFSFPLPVLRLPFSVLPAPATTVDSPLWLSLGPSSRPFPVPQCGSHISFDFSSF